MIDAFNEIYTPIAEQLRTDFPGIFLSGEYIESPPKFPCVTITEADNFTHKGTLDSSHKENHAGLMYEINAYSNLKSGKRAQCRKIMSIIDNEFQSINFVRIMMSEVPNKNDASIFRIVARYEAVISTDHTIYRR